MIGKRSTSRGHELPEDLSALARRDALSEAGQRRLELCLASSESLRALHEVGLDFDNEDSVLPNDRALIARLAARAQSARAESPRWYAKRWLPAAAIGAALGLVGALGAAASFGHLSWHRVETPVEAPAAAKAAATRGTKHTAPRRQPAIVTGSAPSEPAAELSSQGVSGRLPAPNVEKPDPGTPNPTAPKQVAPKQGAADPEPVESAASLFALANAARRKGDVATAESLYSRLQTTRAESAEALLSHVVLGRLVLGRGDSSAALTQFELYLRRAPSGTLAEEALEGRAQALRALGHRDAELAAWRELLSRFPASIYAETARERLVEQR